MTNKLNIKSHKKRFILLNFYKLVQNQSEIYFDLTWIWLQYCFIACCHSSDHFPSLFYIYHISCKFCLTLWKSSPCQIETEQSLHDRCQPAWWSHLGRPAKYSIFSAASHSRFMPVLPLDHLSQLSHLQSDHFDQFHQSHQYFQSYQSYQSHQYHQSHQFDKYHQSH